VYQHPLAFAGRSDTICQDNSFTITHATASHYRNLLWTTNGPGILTGDSTLTPTYTPATGEYGTITLTLIAFGILPCGNDTSRMNLLIIPKPVTTFAHDAAICEGRSFSITGVTASNYQSVTWSTSGSGYFNDPANLQPVYYPGVGDITAGYVYLFLKVNPLYPCLALTDSIKLTINQAPVVSAGPGEITCELIPVTLNGAQASNYDSLDWKDNGQGTLTGIHTLTPTYFPLAGETGMVLLTLTAYGKLACSDSAVIAQTWIHIYPAVVAEAGPDRIIPSGTQDTLSGTISGGSGFLRFKWQPLSLLLDSISLNPVTITLLSDTSFILTVTDSLTGCSTTDTVHIRIKKPNSNEFDCIKVYNVITPNGDGLNDEWIIDCIVNYPDNKVEIFNEWGDLVARYTNYDNVSRVWKGTDLRGMHVPDGTYYYVLTIKDMKPKAGWILVRGGW